MIVWHKSHLVSEGSALRRLTPNAKKATANSPSHKEGCELHSRGRRSSVRKIIIATQKRLTPTDFCKSVGAVFSFITKQIGREKVSLPKFANFPMRISLLQVLFSVFGGQNDNLIMLFAYAY